MDQLIVVSMDSHAQAPPESWPEYLEARYHEHHVTFGRKDEHRESLERHGLVTGEVRQVRARRQQQHVDPQLPHPIASAFNPSRMHTHPDATPDNEPASAVRVEPALLTPVAAESGAVAARLAW